MNRSASFKVMLTAVVAPTLFQASNMSCKVMGFCAAELDVGLGAVFMAEGMGVYEEGVASKGGKKVRSAYEGSCHEAGMHMPRGQFWSIFTHLGQYLK